MEIQTFMLCKELRETGEGNLYDASGIGIYRFQSPESAFPLTATAPYYMLLRRPDRGPEKTVTLRMNLIDMDGNAIGAPQNIRVAFTFPGGSLFYSLVGRIDLSFPKIADYRLDITADEKTNPFFYQYDIEVILPPER
ncbi:MAG: hypothetical protein IH891_10470 [Planctomycetes bacterium]|nr:hypothetical protein [Planctomycetota bacterium]